MLAKPAVVIMNRFYKTFFRSVPVILAVGALVLLISVLGAYYFSQKAAVEAESAVDASRINTRILRLFSSMQDAETGQRGYLLTGDERYLTPFTKAASSIPLEVDSLTPILESINVPRSVLDRLKTLTAQKIAEMRNTIDLKSRGDDVQAMALVHSNVGISLMDDLRGISNELQQRGIVNSGLHIGALQDSTTSLSTIIGINAGLLVILALGAAHLTYRHRREIEAAQRTLAMANEGLEEIVAARTEGLQRANNELQSYAYIVSHDLRAPLVNIMGFTEELDRASRVFRTYLTHTGADSSTMEGKDAIEAVETDIPEALGFIRSSMRRMDNLINQILIMARAGNRELQRERIRLSELVDDTLATLRHRLDEAQIEVEQAGTLPEVQSDKMALQQIVGNLLDNAIKYMDPARRGKIIISGGRNGMFATFEIRDNGRGIADGDQERIFELFRRSGRQDMPGDGVGLAHVRALARRLGGDVAVRSELGTGTTFVVTVATDLAKIRKDGAS